jgi:hypothetical protein
MDAIYFNYEMITTPGLHFLTFFNQFMYKRDKNRFNFVKKDEYSKFLKNGYQSFKIFHEQFFKNMSDKYETEINIDCGNGLCSVFENEIRNIFENDIKMKFINNDINDIKNLNNKSGAEYLHKDKIVPSNQPNIVKNVSFDGDVDRIIY